MIDLHCHILPGLDDGPATLQDALTMADVMVARGVRTVAATPHIDHHFRLDPGGLAERRAELSGALAEHGIGLELVAGGEVALSRLPDLTQEDVDALRLGGGPYLLVEAPLTPAAGDFEPLLLRARTGGLEVLLAHPERCPGFHRRPERLERLVGAGLLCQVTAGSFRGEYGGTVQRFTVEMARAGLVHVVASDAHDAYRRPPGLREPLERAEREVPGLTALSGWLTEDVPTAVLAGTELPERPPLPPPAPRGPRWLARLRGQAA